MVAQSSKGQSSLSKSIAAAAAGTSSIGLLDRDLRQVLMQ